MRAPAPKTIKKFVIVSRETARASTLSLAAPSFWPAADPADLAASPAAFAAFAVLDAAAAPACLADSAAVFVALTAARAASCERPKTATICLLKSAVLAAASFPMSDSPVALKDRAALDVNLRSVWVQSRSLTMQTCSDTRILQTQRWKKRTV